MNYGVGVLPVLLCAVPPPPRHSALEPCVPPEMQPWSRTSSPVLRIPTQRNVRGGPGERLSHPTRLQRRGAKLPHFWNRCTFLYAIALSNYSHKHAHSLHEGQNFKISYRSMPSDYCLWSLGPHTYSILHPYQRWSQQRKKLLNGKMDQESTLLCVLPLSTKESPGLIKCHSCNFINSLSLCLNVDNNQSANFFYDSCHFNLACYLGREGWSVLTLCEDINQGPATPDYGGRMALERTHGSSVKCPKETALGYSVRGDNFGGGGGGGGKNLTKWKCYLHALQSSSLLCILNKLAIHKSTEVPHSACAGAT